MTDLYVRDKFLTGKTIKRHISSAIVKLPITRTVVLSRETIKAIMDSKEKQMCRLKLKKSKKWETLRLILWSRVDIRKQHEEQKEKFLCLCARMRTKSTYPNTIHTGSVNNEGSLQKRCLPCEWSPNQYIYSCQIIFAAELLDWQPIEFHLHYNTSW